MPNRDLILLETVKTHRARLTSAFVYGELEERRVANDGLRRVLGGIVLTAVICVGCVGFSLVSSLLGTQAAQKREQAGQGPATGAIVAADTFDRRVDRGWGTADRGGRWSTVGPARDFAVAGGAARISLGDGDRRAAYLPGELLDRSDVTARVQRGAGAGSGTVVASVYPRRASSTQDYRADLALRADGSVALAISRQADPTGPSAQREQLITPTVILIGPAEDPAESEPLPIAVRVQAIGTSPTVLRAKAWVATGTEPGDWTVTGSDSTADLQRPGTVGVAAARTSGGGPAELLVTDLVARVAP